MPQIVTINESVIRGAQPNLLQQKGCLISLGASKLSVGESRYVGTLSDLMALLNPADDTMLQSMEPDSSPPYIRTDAVRGNANLPVDPPVAGTFAANDTPFNATGLAFETQGEIAKGATSFTVTAPSNVLPANFVAASLSFSNLKKGSDSYAGAASYAEVANGNLVLTIMPTALSGTDAVIPAGTVFSVDISGQSRQDNSAAIAELSAMGASWFANSSAGCYVLELGIRTANTMGSTFSDWFANNLLLYYGYVFPRGASTDTVLASFLANQSSDNSRAYFFLCGDDQGYKTLIKNGEGQKSVFYGVEYTGTPVLSGTVAADTSHEHLAAAVCAQFCSARPTALNRLAPMSFRILTGITPWPEAKNSTYFQKFKTDNAGFAGTSNEGGVQGSILFWGNFMNGDTMSGWYGADWCSINLELQLANVLIEGSQPGLNPLVYDQQGISRLAARAEQTLDSSVSAGCVLADYALTMTPFEQYLNSNPSDYPAGIYNGLAATITPVRGFTSLTFNLAVDFSGQSVVAAATSSKNKGV